MRFTGKLIVLFLFSGAVSLHAQQPQLQRKDTRSEVMANLDKAGGIHYMYELDLPAPTPAPKGYKPFYISHIARHGARYGLGTGGENLYEKLNGLLQEAHRKGKLTPQGEELYRHYTEFYPHVAFRGGELTRKGQEQHRRIADKIYKDYPQVFRGPTHAEAISTNSHRVLLSMLSFLDELAALDADFEFGMDAGNSYMDKLLPIAASSPVYKAPKPLSEEAKRQQEAFDAGHKRTGAFIGRFFNDPEFVEKKYGRTSFQHDMWVFVTCLQCLDTEPEYKFEDIFSPEDRYDYWQTYNYGLYLKYGRTPHTDDQRVLLSAYVLKDFMDKADADMASGTTNLRLRFSHDSALMPLMSFMYVNGFGASVADPEEVASYWRTFEIPMGCNFQLIFFRGKKNDEILVKPVFNGREATLPFPSVTGPFYSWKDFKAYYTPMVEDAIRFLDKYGK